MSEKILVFNAYGGANRKGDLLAKWVQRLGVRVGLISELGRLTDELNKIGTVYASARDVPRDVGVLVVGRERKGVKWRTDRLTPFVKRPGAEKDRLWRDRHYVRVRLPFKRVYWALHANALIHRNGQWLDNAGADVWRKALRDLERMIKEDIEAGYRVRVGGDMNFPDSREEWGPRDFFNRLGLEAISDNAVMWFAWDGKHDRLVKSEILPTAPGADAHRCIFVELKRKRFRKD